MCNHVRSTTMMIIYSDLRGKLAKYLLLLHTMLCTIVRARWAVIHIVVFFQLFHPSDVYYISTHLRAAQSISVPMSSSEATHCKTEIHIANTTSKVMWSCSATGNEHEGGEVQISTRAYMGCKGTRDESALYFVTSFGIGYFVRPRLGGDHADGAYEISYVIPLASVVILPVRFQAWH